jgi:hypothetical protein
MRNMLVTSAVLAALSSAAVAQELNEDAKKLAANTVSYKFTVCAAFHGYNSMCLADQDPVLKAKAEEVKKDFLDIALSTATVAGVKIPDVVVTRYWIAFKDFQKQTNHNCLNISVLLGRYAAPCKALIQNPEAVLKSHLEKARQTVERSKQDPPPTAVSPSIPPTGSTSVVPESSTTTMPEPRARSPTTQEFKKAVGEDIRQHPTTGTKKGLSSGKVNAADRGNFAAAHAAKADPWHPALGKFSKTYADKLTAYLGLDSAATESARTTALAGLAAALGHALKKPVSAEVVSAINTRLAEQDPALATALASADPTLNQSIADIASALSRTGGEQEAVGDRLRSRPPAR